MRQDNDFEEENQDENSPSFRIEGAEEAMQEALRAIEEREAREKDARKKGSGNDARVAELEKELEARSAEANEWKEKALRTMADFENLRKRALREKEEARHYGAENLLRDLLQVIDNMERAVEAAGEAEQIREGVRLTHDQFKGILRQHGVEVIESTGSAFDPHRHEAVAHVPTAEHEPGMVIQEHRRGYRLRERLLRPAMVSVAKALEAPKTEE